MTGEAIVKVIFGIRGGGKTVKLRRLLLGSGRFVAVNTLNRAGFSNGVVFTDLQVLKKFWLSVYRANFRLVYSPQHGDLERVRDEVGEICSLSLACGDMTLAIEEMNVLFEGNRKPSEFERVVFAGREPGVSLIGVAQKPTGFGDAMRAMTKEAFIFHTHEKTHLDVYRNLVGKEGAEAIRTLGQYEYVHWVISSGDNGAEEYTIQKDEPLPSM